MPARPEKKITISILIPFLVFVLFFSMMIWQKYRSSQVKPVVSPQQKVGDNRLATLFFAAEGIRLARETRTLGPCNNDDECLNSVLEELLNGPVADFEETIPEGTTVNSVHIELNQATIDLNRVFADSMPSGSSAEMLAVYSVVNTVAVNFPQIKKIKINIDGNGGTILRHLDLSDPLLPDYSLEQSSQEPESDKRINDQSKGGVP